MTKSFRVLSASLAKPFMPFTRPSSQDQDQDQDQDRIRLVRDRSCNKIKVSDHITAQKTTLPSSH